MKILNVFVLFAVAVAMTFMTACGTADVSNAKMGSSDLDSASYSFGVLVANRFFPKEFYDELNVELLARGIKDARDSSTVIDADAANDIVMRYNKTLQEKQYQPNIDEGEAFLEANKSAAGVKVTPSGLQYKVITEGDGSVQPTATGKVKCNYKGKFVNGDVFDQGEATEFSLTQVIAAWTEGIQMMSPGAKYEFYVPYELGYGERGFQSIEPFKTLIFEVELLEVLPEEAAE